MWGAVCCTFPFQFSSFYSTRKMRMSEIVCKISTQSFLEYENYITNYCSSLSNFVEHTMDNVNSSTASCWQGTELCINRAGCFSKLSSQVDLQSLRDLSLNWASDLMFGVIPNWSSQPEVDQCQRTIKGKKQYWILTCGVWEFSRRELKRWGTGVR